MFLSHKQVAAIRAIAEGKVLAMRRTDNKQLFRPFGVCYQTIVSLHKQDLIYTTMLDKDTKVYMLTDAGTNVLKMLYKGKKLIGGIRL